MSVLFDTYQIGDLKLKNRLVMAPMCMFCAPESGMVTDWHILHYATRAVGGVGLIVLEATAVSPEGRISSNDLGIWDDAHIEGLSKIVDAVHENGCKIGIQLGHAGRKCAAEGMRIEGPSPIAFDEKSQLPKEMTRADIAETIEEFRQAAIRAEKAGFDLIQIHAAHGYLLSEFLSPLCNIRTDEYGGSHENRARLLGEIVAAVRSVWRHKPLEVRVSAEDYGEGGNQAEDLAKMINAVKDKGIDSVNVSTGGVVSVAPKVHPGYQVPHAKIIKEQTGLPVVAGGLILGAKMAEEILERGHADLIFFGRELLRNPYFPLQSLYERNSEQGENRLPQPYRRAF